MPRLLNAHPDRQDVLLAGLRLSGLEVSARPDSGEGDKETIGEAEAGEVTGLERLQSIAASGRKKSWGNTAPSETNRSGEGSEHAHQVDVIRWCRLNEGRYPALRWIFAIPSGEHRHIAVANRLKAEGVKPGLPDLCLPVKRSIYGALWVEMKTPEKKPVRGGKGGLSDAQHAWRLHLLEAGYRHVVAYGADEAIREIEAYLRLGEELETAETSSTTHQSPPPHPTSVKRQEECHEDFR